MTIQKPVIAGNWKLNHGPSQARTFFRELLPKIERHATGSVLLFPPAISFAAARDAAGSDVLLGVQNIYWESSGAFTGEISAELAADAGADVVLVGHSERRHLFGETDADTLRKVRAALAAKLIPLLCVGETLDEREAGQAKAVVERQLAAVLNEVAKAEINQLLIAYEPVWAIGTGRTASPDDASEMHQAIRAFLRDRIADSARAIPLLYGGSVKPDNAAELLAAPEIDGLLIGGASLDPTSFAAICALRG